MIHDTETHDARSVGASGAQGSLGDDEPRAAETNQTAIDLELQQAGTPEGESLLDN